MRVEKPWGYEIIWAKTDKYVGKVLHINEGEALSLQYHNHKDETILVKSGRIKVEYYWNYEDRTKMAVVNMCPGDVFHIQPGLCHRMIALQDADVIEVSTPELDDVVRIEDRYGRVYEEPPPVRLSVFKRFAKWLNTIFRK